MRNTVMAATVVVAAAAASGLGSSQEGLAWTSADFQRVGQFLSELTRSLIATTASICVLQGEGINGSVSDYWRLAGVLTRNFVFVTPCEAPQPSPRPCLTASKPPLAPIPPTCDKNSQIDIYITDTKQMEETVNLVAARYKGSRGDVRQVVVGRQVEPPKQVAPDVMSWIFASYDPEALVVDVQEMFSFRDSAGGFVAQPLGTWRPGLALSLSHPPGFGPMDFQGHTIFVASFPYPPFIMRGEMCTKPTLSDEAIELLQNHCFVHKPRRLLNDEVYTGYFMDILNTLSKKLNFTYRVVLPDDPENYVFGTGRTDNYSGLVGMVATQKAEIALAILSMSQERLDDIDFSTNVDAFVRNIYIRANATENSLGWGTYALAFELSTWLGTLCLYLVTACVMWAVSRRERDQMPRDIFGFKDIVFMFFSCMVQQGVPTTPVSLRGRTVFLLFWVSCVVTYTYYTARLTSYLAVSTVKPPFQTLAEAVASFPEWQVGLMRGTPLKSNIEDSEGEVYQLLSSRLTENSDLLVDTEQEGVHKLLTENYAFLADTPTMDYLFRGNCSVRELHVNLFPSYGRLGYMKNLPFSGVLNGELTRLNDGGVLDRLHRQWWGHNIPCEEPSPFTELDFTHTVTAFAILLSGVIFSLIIFIVEIIHKQKMAREPVVLERDLKTGMFEAAERRRGRKREARRYADDPSVYLTFMNKGRGYPSS